MSLVRFRDAVAERAICLEPLGFTERQSRFLATVMAHSGVFLERQYCRFAGIADGQKSHDFIDRLVDRGFARVEATSHLYQGRFYHLHHKRLYRLLGQTDNRNRKRAHRSRGLGRPRTSLGNLAAFRKRQRRALVPSDEPVPDGRLVEERGLVGNRRFPQELRRIASMRGSAATADTAG